MNIVEYYDDDDIYDDICQTVTLWIKYFESEATEFDKMIIIISKFNIQDDKFFLSNIYIYYIILAVPPCWNKGVTK